MRKENTLKNFEINVTEDLMKDCENRIKALPYIPFFILPIYLFVIFTMWLGNGDDANFWQVMTFVIILMLLGVLLVVPYIIHDRNLLVSARKNAGNKELLFKVNDDEVTIPVLILGDPAFWIATEKRLSEIIVPLKHIESVEQHKSYILVYLQGESTIWGRTRFSFYKPRLVIKKKYLKEEFLKNLNLKVG
jgi:hypothetical protein